MTGTTLGDQVARQVDLATAAAPSISDPWRRQQVISAASGVYAAWTSDPIPGLLLPTTAQCQRWATTDSWVLRTLYGDCSQWTRRLEAAIAELADALAAAGKPGAAEAAEALADQVATIRESREDITDMGEGPGFWAPLPTPVKAGILLGLAWIAADFYAKLK